MKYLTAFWVFGLISTTTMALEKQKIVNSGFERGLTGWTPCGTWGGFSPNDKQTLMESCLENPRSGKKCLKISDTWEDKAPYVIQSKIPADLSKGYIVEFWVRAEKPTVGVAKMMMMEDVNGKNKFRSAVSDTFEATQEWQKVEMIVEKLASRTARLVLGFVPGKEKKDTATIYVDDISIYPVTPKELQQFLLQ